MFFFHISSSCISFPHPQHGHVKGSRGDNGGGGGGGGCGGVNTGDWLLASCTIAATSVFEIGQPELMNP